MCRNFFPGISGGVLTPPPLDPPLWWWLVLDLKDYWGRRLGSRCLPQQLALRAGQLWEDGRSTLQLHQQRQAAHVSAHLTTSLVLPPDSEIVAPVPALRRGFGRDSVPSLSHA